MIRQAKETDLKRLAEMEEELFDVNPWPMNQFLYELKENPFASILVYELDQEVVGYLDLWVMYEQAQIATIGTAKSNQRQGIAQKLMDRAVTLAQEKGCENLTLEVRKDNAKAVALYEKNGFIKAAERKHYYEDGMDAWLLIKPIGGLYDENLSD